jgi:uncharacterized protein (TIGR03435 family)
VIESVRPDTKHSRLSTLVRMNFQPELCQSFTTLLCYLSTHRRDRIIVNDTGLKGVYDFSVDYEVDTEKVRDRSVPVSEAGASLMEDLARALGLKIESGRRLPVETLVIDQISPPDPD